LHFFGLNTFIHAWRLYFTTLSVNKYKQIHKFNFSIKGHVHYVYVCVSKITYYCASRGYIHENCCKLILCCMFRR
jgi:hypothetical protein